MNKMSYAFFVISVLFFISCGDGRNENINDNDSIVNDSENIDEDEINLDDDVSDKETPDYDVEVVYNDDFIVEKHWTKQWGSRLEEGHVSIVEIKDDLIYLESSTYGKIDDITYYNGDALIQVMDRNGNVEDLIQWGTSDFDTMGDFFILEDGSIFSVGITIGAFEGFVNEGSVDGNPCEVCEDIYITKLSSNGEILKTAQFGTLGSDRAYKVLKSINNNEFIVYGYSSGKFEETEQIGLYDVIIFVFDYDLKLKSAHVFGSERSDFANEIFYDKDGNLLISGQTQGDVAKETAEEHSSPVYTDNFLIKLDKDFNIVWKKQYFRKDLSMSVHTIKTGNDGLFYSMGSCLENKSGITTFCYFLRTLNAVGDETFFKKWDSENMMNVYNFGFLSGLIFFAGQKEEKVLMGDDLKSKIFLSAITLKGETVFEYSWGSEGKENVDSIAISGNEIYVTGTTTGDLDGNINLTGEKPDYEDNKSDFFMTKFIVKTK